MRLSAGENKNDRLTAYDGTSITYDDIGNPITIGDMSLTWEGRQLKEFSVPALYTCQYTYNADGIRTSKTIDGAVHSYVLDGSRIVSETIGSGHIFIYLYDETGSPIGIKYRRSNYAAEVYDYFFFEKNLQGDIIAVYNESGAKICTYTYDAWGKVTTTYVTTNAVERYISTNNPFRYRGYYYDIETGWYYLQTRYYNPTWGRFLNADSSLYNSMLGFNLFAYCVNNPVSFVDPTGEWFIIDDIVTGPIDEIIVIGGIALLALLGSDWAEDALVAAVDAVDAVSELFDSEEEENVDSPKDNTDAPQNTDHGLPIEGEPNSDQELYDEKGLKQKRHYRSDGKAEYDIDYHHPDTKGTHEFPHRHNWNWDQTPTRSKPIKIFPNGGKL